MSGSPYGHWAKVLVLKLEIAHLPQYLGLFAVGVVAYRRDWFRSIPDRTGKLWLGIGRRLHRVPSDHRSLWGGVLERNEHLFMG